ncbi:MAG: efflux RND transporter periplasmic adaptor subunit [Odoribacter sp.]
MKVIVQSILWGCIVSFLGACSSTDKNAKNEHLRVNVALAKSQDVSHRKEFSFMAKPYRSSDLSFRIGGPIDQFEVYVGNYYKQGEVIAEVDARDFRIRKQRAEAIYQQAKAEFERIEVLFTKNNISASGYEKVKADYTSAKMAYETALNELEDTQLKAPFNGYVGEVYMEKYQDVKATQPVISLVNIEQLKIEVYVTQEIAFASQDLKEVSLRFDAMPDKIYRAQVTEVSKSTTRNNLSYLLTALLSNKDGKLLAGMSGKVFFDAPALATDRVVTIPQTALCHRPTEGDYVWVVAATGRVEQRKIVLGELLQNGVVSVVSGLNEKEQVAVSGLRFLSDGTQVDVSQGSRSTGR